MKGLFKRLSILTASLAMVFGVGLVNDEKSAKASESSYKTLTFPEGNSKGVSSYTDTWTATINGDSYTIKNANNNNNGWSYIKFGSKKDASIGTISTDFAIDKAITKVVVTIDSVTEANVNSTYLEIASDSNFTTIIEKTNVAIKAGNLEYSITNPTENLYYKLTYDCKKSSNGIIQVSKVAYYATDKNINNLSYSGTLSKTEYTTDDTFSPDGLTITANYSDNTTEDVTNDVIWPALTVGMTSITGTYKDKTIEVTGITVTQAVAIYTLTINLDVKEIYENTDGTLSYELKDNKGNDFTGNITSIAWTSSNTNVIDIDQESGYYIASSIGTTTIELWLYTDNSSIYFNTKLDLEVKNTPSYIVDTLTAKDLNLLVVPNKITYSDFSNISSLSGIKYAGNAANNSGKLQLRSSNSNSGIVSTTAKRILTKVEVEWASGNTSGRTVDVYGYNTAFNDASELYNTKAEKLGSITTPSTTLEISTDTKYAYVGIRSNNGALYLASISFTWDISEDANDFIDMWNKMRADGGKYGICGYLNGTQDSSKLDELLEMYDILLDDAAKAIVNNADDGSVGCTIENTIAYIKAYKASHTSSSANLNISDVVTNNVSFIFIVAVLGLASILGYYFINKKRMLSK